MRSKRSKKKVTIKVANNTTLRFKRNEAPNEMLGFEDLIKRCYDSDKVDGELVSLIERVCKDDKNLQKQIRVFLNSNDGGPAALNSLYKQVREFKNAIKNTSDIRGLINYIEFIFNLDSPDKAIISGSQDVSVSEEIEPLLDFVKDYHDKEKKGPTSGIKRVAYKLANKQNNDDLLFKLFIQYPDEMNNFTNPLNNDNPTKEAGNAEKKPGAIPGSEASLAAAGSKKLKGILKTSSNRN